MRTLIGIGLMFPGLLRGMSKRVWASRKTILPQIRGRTASVRIIWPVRTPVPRIAVDRNVHALHAAMTTRRFKANALIRLPALADTGHASQPLCCTAADVARNTGTANNGIGTKEL